MSFTPPANYYNRFDASKNYDEHMFIAGRSLQSAELNEIQRSSANRLSNVANVLFRDGSIIRDCSVIVNPTTGAVVCSEGAVYAHGAVRTVAASTMTISVNSRVAIGIRLVETVISDLNDAGLRDPATAVQNFDGPGALRLKIDAVWANHLDGGAGEFFAIYDVLDGYVSAKEAPPNIDAMSAAIQKYDRDSTGGTYIVSGLQVATSSKESDLKHVYRVGSGAARIAGMSLDMVSDRAYMFDAAPDLKLISSEPFLSATSASQRVTTDFAPIATISLVSITALKTATIVHGVVVGAMDLLPDTSIIEIVSAVQGGTTFVHTTDYQLTGGLIDWSPAGAEPASGSTYSVTYKYVEQVTPTAIDDTGFTVAGAVSGTLVMMTYQYKVPRIDRFCLDILGGATLLKGVSSVDLPAPPAVPKNLLLLATVKHSWFSFVSPTMDGTRMVSMDALNSVSSQLDRLLMLVTQSRLEANASGRDAALKKSIFTDPFIDDSMRDAGITQNAAVVGGALTLPVSLNAGYFSTDIAAPITLPFSPTFSISQDLSTSSMKVNPYNSFGIMPSTMSLLPSVDQMSYAVETWTSSTTNRIVSKVSTLAEVHSTSIGSVNLVSSETVADQFIRPQIVRFKIDGFTAGELLSRISFDSVDIMVISASTLLEISAAADASGHIEAAFCIPGGRAAGVKQVQFIGSNGSWGTSYFTSTSWTTNKSMSRHTTEFVYEYDPVMPQIVHITNPVTIIREPIVTVVTETYTGPVATLYHSFLNRDPDPSGFAFWAAQVAAAGGVVTAAIMEGFIDAAVSCNETLGTSALAIWTLAHDRDDGICNIDPLAQTFMLDTDAQISSIDLWFSSVGTSDVIVQLRSISNGVPTREVLAECRKLHSAITTSGAHTRFDFRAPVTVSSNEEVAVVVMANDAVTQVAIAEIGKWSGSRWVTDQPYTVGVLLSSSNAISWTTHQDRDLKFRVVTSTYTSNTLLVDLGVVAVNSVTDLMVMGLASKPSSNTAVTYLVTLPGGAVKTTSANVPLNLPSAVTGNVRVQAVLAGSASMSPVLYPSSQLLFGSLGSTADYVSRAMAAGPSSRIRVIVDALIPSGATVAFHWKGGDVGDTWSASAIPFLSSVASDSGFVEMTYEVSGINENLLQIKAILTGTAAARPFLRDLRVMVM